MNRKFGVELELVGISMTTAPTINIAISLNGCGHNALTTTYSRSK